MLEHMSGRIYASGEGMITNFIIEKKTYSYNGRVCTVKRTVGRNDLVIEYIEGSSARLRPLEFLSAATFMAKATE